MLQIFSNNKIGKITYVNKLEKQHMTGKAHILRYWWVVIGETNLLICIAFQRQIVYVTYRISYISVTWTSLCCWGANMCLTQHGCFKLSLMYVCLCAISQAILWRFVSIIALIEPPWISNGQKGYCSCFRKNSPPWDNANHFWHCLSLKVYVP